jgi:heterodisulfide reductase subunit D
MRRLPMSRHIDELKGIVYQCNRCAQCLDFSQLGQKDKCPAYRGRQFESYAARGKFNLARALVDGVLEYDADVAERIYSCTECRGCAENCFKYLDTTGIFAAMKEDLAERDLIPERYRQALEGERGLDEVHNVYQASPQERLAWLIDRSRIDRPAETALFVGCTSAYARQNMAVDTAGALQRLGVDYTVASDEWCCGHPYIAAGEMAKAREALEHTIALYERLGVRRVVFNCPGCLKTFKHDAPKLLGRRLPFEPVHVLEEIAHLAERGDLTFRPVSPKITATHNRSRGRHRTDLASDGSSPLALDPSVGKP